MIKLCSPQNEMKLNNGLWCLRLGCWCRKNYCLKENMKATNILEVSRGTHLDVYECN